MVMVVVKAMTMSIPKGKTYGDVKLTLDEALRRVNLVGYADELLAGRHHAGPQGGVRARRGPLAYLIGREGLDGEGRKSLSNR